MVQVFLVSIDYDNESTDKHYEEKVVAHTATQALDIAKMALPITADIYETSVKPFVIEDSVPETYPPITGKEQEIIDRNFYFQELEGYQSVKCENLKSWFPEVARAIMFFCPDSRERSLALTNLEQSMFWALEGIRRNK